MARYAVSRTFVALCAATLGVLICLHQRHFVLVPGDPASYARMLHHRCGMVMSAAVGWAALECLALMLGQHRTTNHARVTG